MRVPFLDLQAQYKSIQQEINEALQAVMDKTAFAGGAFRIGIRLVLPMLFCRRMRQRDFSIVFGPTRVGNRRRR